jgi:hypothetical protein
MESLRTSLLPGYIHHVEGPDAFLLDLDLEPLASWLEVPFGIRLRSVSARLEGWPTPSDRRTQAIFHEAVCGLGRTAYGNPGPLLLVKLVEPRLDTRPWAVQLFGWDRPGGGLAANLDLDSELRRRLATVHVGREAAG